MDLVHVRRPCNSFILFANQHRRDALQLCKNNAAASMLLGQAWRCLPAEEQDKYKVLANNERNKHQFENPNYKYRPCANRNKRRLNHLKVIKQTRVESTPETIIGGWAKDLYKEYESLGILFD